MDRRQFIVGASALALSPAIAGLDGLSVASLAETKAGLSADPVVARAWAIIGDTGELLNGYNVKSVEVLGTGEFKLTFADDFEPTNPAVATVSGDRVTYVAFFGW